MTKEEFVSLVADKGGLSKVDAGRAVDAFCDSVSAALGRGEQVRLPGFGNFEVQERGERAGRNPPNGEAIPHAPSQAAEVRARAGARRRGAAPGRTLRPGEAITIAASKAVKFSAGARLKGAVNGGGKAGQRTAHGARRRGGPGR